MQNAMQPAKGVIGWYCAIGFCNKAGSALPCSKGRVF